MMQEFEAPTYPQYLDITEQFLSILKDLIVTDDLSGPRKKIKDSRVRGYSASSL
jgi:hypothetical protein